MSKWLSVEKMKKWRIPVGAEERLFCVVCEVGDPPVHGDGNYVVKRVQDSINRWGYARIYLRDFDKLEGMYGVNWKETHKDIFRHKKKSAYALLYWGDLLSAAKNAMKNHLATNISELDINDASFSGNADVKILTIKGTKPDGRHMCCDFVDVNHAKTILSSSKTFHASMVLEEIINARK